jgi:hypothetical protein
MDNYYGIIAEQTDDRDWLGSDIILPRAPKGTSSFLRNGATQYDQSLVSRVSCTVHGAMGAYSDLTGYKFTLDERKHIWQQALDRGADSAVGWYINSAVDLVRQWVNTYQPIKVNSYRVDVGSPVFNMAMRLGYSPVMGYRGNILYNTDRDDGILDSTEFINTTYGHCLRGCYFTGHITGYECKMSQIVDNYPYRNTNLYFLPMTNWEKLVENKIFFKHAYIYLTQ